VIFYDPFTGDSVYLVTDKNGRYEKMEQFPECVYTIFYNDENTGFFTSATKQKVEIKQGILNELEPVILEDTCNPHILNQSPSDAIINIRKPLIHAVLADKASGIAKETLLLVFNGDTISNSSLNTYNDSGFSWIPARLPDGTHTVYTSIKDSAGNGDTLIWTFNVDAMKLYITADSTVDINSPITMQAQVYNVYSNVAEYKWNFDGDTTWDTTVTWDGYDYSYNNLQEDNIAVQAVLFSQADGFAEAAAMARPGVPGSNVVGPGYTHTVFGEEGTATW